MKNLIVLFVIALASQGLYAQSCCNVVDGSGLSVVDANGNCVIAPNSPGYQPCDSGPDADGDGVADTDDMCPNEAGLAENKGCPDLNEDEKEVIKAAIAGVNFVFGKAELTEESKPKLKAVASLLNAHEGFKLRVEGHTDNTGDEESNLQLSRDRALAVKNYLIEEGISEKRIFNGGYGETKPIASNDTEEGRAQNRRVEFKVIY